MSVENKYAIGAKKVTDYKTIGEVSVVWGVSARYVQYLCREGKIEGAIKSSGAWLIPTHAQSPLKNTKTGSESFQFVGTKKKIFDTGLELFMQKGYENVSIRNIADKVGIKQSAIYNHFKSKQEILDTIYGFCRYYYLLDRPSIEDIEPKLQNGTLSEIVSSVHYDFDSSYLLQLTYAIKIVYQRSCTDDEAKIIVKSLFVDEGIRFANAVYRRAVDIGRLSPFDTYALAVFSNSVRLYMLINWIVDDTPENTTRIYQEDQILCQYASTLLEDLKPAN